MKLLVTGSLGFVGSAVMRAGEREALTLVRAIRPGQAERASANAEAVALDFSDRVALVKALRTVRADCCLHLAWYVKHGKYLGANENLTSLTDSLKLFEALIEAGCSRIVGVGTCFEYDTTPGLLSEETRTEPRTLYAAAKLSARLLLEQLCDAARMEWVWARLFYLYGPGEHPDRLVPRAIAAGSRGEPLTLRGSAHVRDYLHVDDVARALLRVATGRISGVVNVGSGRPLPIRDLVTQVGALLHREIDVVDTVPREDDPPVICADIAKITRATDWRPTVELADGLQQCIAATGAHSR